MIEFADDELPFVAATSAVDASTIDAEADLSSLDSTLS